MQLSYSGRSDIGLIRKANQDRWSHAHCPWGDLFVVADGLGHPEGGQFASQTTVDFLKDKFSEKEPGEIPLFFRQTIDKANSIVNHQKTTKYGNAMMGSTCVALVIQRDYAYLVHAGDSRAYCSHNGKLTQLTKDHSLVQEMVNEGVISKGEAENHPNKNVVTRAIGATQNIEPEVQEDPTKLSAGDKFLLCSDGLWGSISSKDMEGILHREKPKAATKRLIELAKENGGQDNITVQVIHVF